MLFLDQMGDLVRRTRRRTAAADLRANRERQLRRIVDWARAHKVRIDASAPAFRSYRLTYLQLDPTPFAGRPYPFFALSTGHSGSMWLAYLCQLLDPDHMICLHDHETVRAWIDFRSHLKDEGAWLEWMHRVRRAREKSRPREALSALCPELCAHMDRMLQTFPVVGYSLTANSGDWLSIMGAAAQVHPAAKVLLLARNGALVVNSVFRFRTALQSMVQTGVAAGGVDRELLRETLRAHGEAGYATLSVRPDPILGVEADLYEDCVSRYPAYREFTRACYTWRACTKWLNGFLSGLAPDRAMTVRLEDLTSEVSAVSGLHRFFFGDDHEPRIAEAAAALAQSTNVNRKVSGQSAISVLRQWDATQRGIFSELCGELNAQLGYCV